MYLSAPLRPSASNMREQRPGRELWPLQGWRLAAVRLRCRPLACAHVSPLPGRNHRSQHARRPHNRTHPHTRTDRWAPTTTSMPSSRTRRWVCPAPRPSSPRDELTTAKKVPCTFELTVPGLGYVEGNMDGHVRPPVCLAPPGRIITTPADEAGLQSRAPTVACRDACAQVGLPFYAEHFCIVLHYSSQSLNTSSLVTLDPPSALAPRVLNALKADPRTVDLRALAPHFYGLGARILDLFEEEDMIEVLTDVRDSITYLPSPLTLCRRSKPGQQSLLTRRITREAPLAKVPNSCEVSMRTRGNVSGNCYRLH